MRLPVRGAAELPGPPLRLAFLGDPDGLHTRRWLRVFIERGHEVHFISYYRPRREIDGVRLHVLSNGQTGRRADGQGANEAAAQVSSPTGAPPLQHLLAQRVPDSMMRLVQARRYMNAGLRRVLDQVKPDVFHAFYVVEHGFFGAFAHYHPYVVGAWGSDLFVAPKTPAGRMIARYALHQAELVTCADPAMRQTALQLGVPEDKTALVRMGVDELFFDAPISVNFEAAADQPPTVLSDRALEPLYNVETVVRAFAALRTRLPEAQLIVAHNGSQRRRLEAVAAELGLGESVRFVGRLEPEALRDQLARAHVYVSVPSSDSLSLSTMEAMAVGAFPVVSDLPSQDGWIDDGVNGLRVPAGHTGALAEALYKALSNADLRWRAMAQNRVHVATEGDLTKNMLAMERHYYRLAGRELAGDGAG